MPGLPGDIPQNDLFATGKAVFAPTRFSNWRQLWILAQHCKPASTTVGALTLTLSHWMGEGIAQNDLFATRFCNEIGPI